MTAATLPITGKKREGKIVYLPVQASTSLKAGWLIVSGKPGQGAGVAGYAKSLAAADAATHDFVGVAEEDCDNSAGAAGAKSVSIRVGAEVELVSSGAAVTDVGKRAFATDNQTASVASVSGAGWDIGVISAYISATAIRVFTSRWRSLDSANGQRIMANVDWAAAALSKNFFTATRYMRVRKAYCKVTVAGTDGSAVTLMLGKTPDGTPIASATSLLSAAFNLKGTAATNQVGSLSATAADLLLAPGDSLSAVITGTPTNATGSATVELEAVE